MISVIVPVYNTEPWLQMCIDSVLAGQYLDFELLLVIDVKCSDGSLGIAQENARRDRRIRVIESGEDGVSAVRNRGIDEAQGEYIFFLDSDDRLHPGALDRFVSEAQQHDADMVAPCIAYVYMDGDRVVRTYVPPIADRVLHGPEIPQSVVDLLTTYFYNFPSKMYRASILREHSLRFNTRISLGEDALFNLDFLRHCECVVNIGEPQYDYMIYLVRSEQGLLRKFRADYYELKYTWCQQLLQYLTTYHAIDTQMLDEFFSVCITELFSCFVNIFKAPDYTKQKQKDSCQYIFTGPLTQALFRHRFTARLDWRRRMTLRAMKTKSTRVMRFVCWLYSKVSV